MADDLFVTSLRRALRASRSALVPLAFAGVLVVPAGADVADAAPGCGRGGLNETQLDAAFASPGLGATATTQGFGGGDYPHAYPLPDGRVFWMFQDLHFSNDESLLNDVPDGSPTNAAHNAGMVQQGECFTILGGRGRDLIGDAQTVDGRTWFWPLDGEIGVDGNLWIFMVEMNNPSGGGAGYGALPVRTWIAILDRNTLQQLYFEPAPDTSNRLYGWSVASNDRWSYLYSHCYRQYANPGNSIGQFDASCMPNTYLARVPKGNFVAAPEYWNGSTWTTNAAAAVPITSRNVANPMSVQWFGDVFVSVTKENEWWGTRLIVDRAPAPQGPWTTVTTRSVLGDMKCSTCGNYGAFLMPWLDQNGKMIVGLSSGGDFDLWRQNAQLYRPTFHTFDVPARADTARGGDAPGVPGRDRQCRLRAGRPRTSRRHPRRGSRVRHPARRVGVGARPAWPDAGRRDGGRAQPHDRSIRPGRVGARLPVHRDRAAHLEREPGDRTGRHQRRDRARWATGASASRRSARPTSSSISTGGSPPRRRRVWCR